MRSGSRRQEYCLARAYVPFQIMDQVYNPREALKKGTLFPDLYMACGYENRRY
ncbi:spore coat associated protein CotJA [Anaerosalibacter massiliensis]|uniref:Spore coat associated protein CotJA n=1 Tax=Anaerosalibacter massiliensis TaxID=1347392 RepID=A0A9X2S4K0_9FIRM|nr:spore coat associated protein CotJA [Anaerosalibacter massiliensis]MCR2043349.1 spore coat associated protein CotJA [Anaerosalibacter massiliensis]